MTRTFLVRRYWFLCILFGVAFGIRYTLDVWLVSRLGAGKGGWDWKFAYVMLSLAFMLVGELLAATVSDYRSRVRPTVYSALWLMVWAGCAAAAIGLEDPLPMLAAGIAFGLAFGLNHAGLEAWLDDALDRLAILEGQPHLTRQVSDRTLYWGGVLLYLGIFGGSIVAFPLLAGGNLRAELKSLPLDSGAALPYLVALVAAGLILLRSPPHVPTPERPPEQRRDRTRVVQRLLHGYRVLLTEGAASLLVALFLGGAVSLLIQFIDHFAPSDMIPGDDVAARTAGVLLYNGIIVVITAGFGWFTQVVHFHDRLSHKQRTWIILGCLGFALAALVALIAFSLAETAKAILIGTAMSALLISPPLIKGWTLDYAYHGLRGGVQSLLGVTKRLFGLVVTFGVWLAIPEKNETMLYVVLAVVAGLGLVILIGVGSRKPPEAPADERKEPLSEPE